MERFIDTHAHYFDERFGELEGGAEGLLRSEKFQSAVKGVINIGTNPENSRIAIRQAAAYPWMAAAVGIHPEDAQGFPGEQPLDLTVSMAELREMVSDPAVRKRDKIVAIGEIGLDYHFEPMDKVLQQQFFEAQLELAAELDLPVIIHDREAHGACCETVFRYPTVRGVFHGYSGSAETAKELMKRGWYIGIGGSVTFKNAFRVREVASSLDPHRVLLETDCPYMAPVPHRGQINHSALIPDVASVLAPLLGLTVGELADLTAENAQNLFDLASFCTIS